MAHSLTFQVLNVLSIVYRWRSAAGFDLASNHLHVALGTINIFVLLVSNFTMALAVHFAQTGHRRWLVVCLLLTAALGAVCLGIKLHEWRLEAAEPLVPGRGFALAGPYARAAKLFFWLYFVMTGRHALHLTIGILIVGLLSIAALRGACTAAHHLKTNVAVMGALFLLALATMGVA